jgi:DNA polymerase
MTDADNNTAYVDEAEVPRCLGGGFTFVLEEGQKTTRQKRQVIFEHYDSLKKRWVEGALYGGLQFENVVQATARDVMIEGMFAAEEKRYPIVLTVHDELLCDVPSGHGSAAELQSIMSTVPSWCQGLPLAAKTWEDVRYAK